MKAEQVSLECLFLHDTQMADLEREQARLRDFAADRSQAGDSGWISVTFTQAFCPLATVLKGSGKLTVGAPEACDGWIVRPVSFERTPATEKPSAQASLPAIPGLPPLPRKPGFILGFADPTHPERAAEIAPGLAKRLTDESGIRSFTVNVWYEATLTLEIAAEEGRSYGVFGSAGKPSWKKLTPISSN